MCVNISSIKRIFSNQSHYFPDIHCIPTGCAAASPNHTQPRPRPRPRPRPHTHTHTHLFLQPNVWIFTLRGINTDNIKYYTLLTLLTIGVGNFNSFWHFHTEVKPKLGKQEKCNKNTRQQQQQYRHVLLVAALEHNWRLTPASWVTWVKTFGFHSFSDFRIADKVLWTYTNWN